ncbi:hypothetical protein UlMin_009809 [Ulmus minor]
MQHLLCNIKTKFRGISIDNLYYPYGKAYHVSDFDWLMHALEMVEPPLRPYLQEFGVHRWSRAHSEGRRYNIMTTNISECLNALFVKERELPVTALAKEMRSTIQSWHYERRLLTEKCKTKLTPEAKKALAEQYQLSICMRYKVFDGDKNDIVDLKALTCSYKRFQLEQ